MKTRILIADDDQRILEVISDILADIKCHITCYQPEISDDRLLQEEYDVAILDIYMSNDDGFSLRKKLLKHSPHTQIIFITAQPDRDLINRATELGIYGFLTKPFTCDQIENTVMGAIRMRKLLKKKHDDDDDDAKSVDLIGILRRIDAIVNCMGEGLLALDNNNAIVLMNGIAEQITGIRFGESAGVPLEHCSIRGEVSEYLRRFSTGVDGSGQIPEDNGIEIRTDDGLRYYSVNINDITGNSSERTGRVILFMDMTETKNMEIMRESFLSVAAHELRTPVTIMSNYLSFIGEMLDNREMLAAAFDDMLLANRRMKYIVNCIVKFMSLYSWKMSSCREAIDIGSIISEGTGMLMAEANEKNVSFEVSALPTLRFFSDPDLVTIAVHNLLNNAVKFNRENSTVHIDVGSCETKGEPVLSIGVSYGGEGMLSGLSDTLFMGGGFPMDVHDGLAIGLFIARRAAILAGGTLRAGSLPGGKGRLILEFPLGN